MLNAGRDKQVLRELGRQVAEIAALPEQKTTIKLWKGLNDLKPDRPMVMIDQIPWHEMDVDGELMCEAEDPFYRGIEISLRRTLYRWRHMRVDMVVEPYVDIAKVIHGAHLGIRAKDERSVLDPENDVVGHYYLDQLKTDDDLEKIRMPEVSLDVEATAEVAERAHEVFDDILQVRLQGLHPTFAFWDRISEWHGVESSLLDLIDRPDFVHRMVRRITDGYHVLLDQLEEQGLLGYPMATIHCTGAYSDELPAEGYDPDRVRTKDLWTFGMAQVFASVSPRMHQEFELDYVYKLYERFGLGYYGCCEPLDNKIGIVRTIPNLRKISMSPWVNVRKGAERIGRDFVFSRKPSPALVATDAMNAEVVRADLQETYDACKAANTPLEYTLKDISTCRYDPRRLWEWADIAMEVARA
jgi:hypothetical protein